MLGGEKEEVKCEKGAGSLSPRETEHLEKSIVDVFTRGGVPVFNLEHAKPKEDKDSVIPRL